MNQRKGIRVEQQGAHTGPHAYEHASHAAQLEACVPYLLESLQEGLRWLCHPKKALVCLSALEMSSLRWRKCGRFAERDSSAPAVGRRVRAIREARHGTAEVGA